MYVHYMYMCIKLIIAVGGMIVIVYFLGHWVSGTDFLLPSIKPYT